MVEQVEREIRELLGGGYSDKGWLGIFKLLHEHRSSDDLERFVDLAEQLVSSWTNAQRADRYRTSHYRDYYELSPAIRLLRELKIYRMSEERGRQYLRLLAKSPYARNIVTLSIVSCELYLGEVAHFCQTAELPCLRNLTIKNTFLDFSEPAAIKASPLAQQLDRLEIIRPRS